MFRDHFGRVVGDAATLTGRSSVFLTAQTWVLMKGWYIGHLYMFKFCFLLIFLAHIFAHIFLHNMWLGWDWTPDHPVSDQVPWPICHHFLDLLELGFTSWRPWLKVSVEILNFYRLWSIGQYNICFKSSLTFKRHFDLIMNGYILY